MITYRGPTLIAEPELRWPILILAAVITALLALSAAGLYYVAMTKLDGKDSDRAHLVMEVTAIRFDQ